MHKHDNHKRAVLQRVRGVLHSRRGPDRLDRRRRGLVAGLPRAHRVVRLPTPLHTPRGLQANSPAGRGRYELRRERPVLPPAIPPFPLTVPDYPRSKSGHKCYGPRTFKGLALNAFKLSISVP